VSRERVTVLIDAEHSKKLMTGERIAIKVPANARVIELQLTKVASDSLVKLIDVLFNGRPA